MFDTLEERIRHDEAAPGMERIAKAAAMVILSIALFGGLYLLVHFSQ